MSVKVSVLVPIYNSEKYLRKCLDSLLTQTLKDDLEVILINDGSTDNSPAIIKEFSEKLPNCKVINKENSGYGSSMNLGIKEAQGEYIGILEADDFIERDAFKNLYRISKKYHTDYTRANYFQHNNNKDEKIQNFNPLDTEKLINLNSYQDIFYRPPAIWSALYRRKFLEENNIKFLETPGASFQDTDFVYKTLFTAKKVIFTNEAYLHYRIDNSASSIHNPQKVFCVCDEFREIERYLTEKGLFLENRKIFERVKFNTYLWNLNHLDKNSAKLFINKTLNEFNAMNPKNLTKKQRIKLVALQHFPVEIFLKLYKINNKEVRWT